MKTLPLTLILCTVAIIGAILAPTSTSGTNELQRLAQLEQDVAFLSRQADCMRHGMSASVYKDAPESKSYLAPTRSAAHRRFWVVVMTPGCMPKHPTKHDMSWRW